MFGRKNKDMPKGMAKGPELPDAVAGAQKDALDQLAISGIRKVVTDRLNQDQFGSIVGAQMEGRSVPETAQARIARYEEHRNKTNRYALLTGLPRVAQHDAEISGMRAAMEKLTPPDEKAQHVLYESQMGTSFDTVNDAVRKNLEELDKKYPNSYEKWAD